MLVSIIILSYNAHDVLERAVASVRAQTYQSIQLIVVDNGSDDGTAAQLQRLGPDVTVLPLRENTGFARGMNLGYSMARGAVIVPLNTDAILHPTFVAEAVRSLREHPDVGVIAAEVCKIPRDAPWRWWEAAASYPSEGGVVALTPLLRVTVLDNPGLPWRPAFKANGACPVIRRTMLDAMTAHYGVAPFDPVFDTYGEDVDFAFKSWALRWRTMYAANVRAGHVRSYASPVALRDKRGRLRINLLAERYINAIRHLPPSRLAWVLVRCVVEDGLLWQQQRASDDAITDDVRTAFERIGRLWPALWRFRRQHRTWQRIDFEHEVFCRM